MPAFMCHWEKKNYVVFLTQTEPKDATVLIDWWWLKAHQNIIVYALFNFIALWDSGWITHSTEVYSLCHRDHCCAVYCFMCIFASGVYALLFQRLTQHTFVFSRENSGKKVAAKEKDESEKTHNKLNDFGSCSQVRHKLRLPLLPNQSINIALNFPFAKTQPLRTINHISSILLNQIHQMLTDSDVKQYIKIK